MGDQPGQAHLLIQLLYAEDPNAVEDGHNSAQAHSDEHESAKGPPGWRAELREQHDDGGGYSDACDLQVMRVSMLDLIVVAVTT